MQNDSRTDILLKTVLQQLKQLEKRIDQLEYQQEIHKVQLSLEPTTIPSQALTPNELQELRDLAAKLDAFSALVSGEPRA